MSLLNGAVPLLVLLSSSYVASFEYCSGTSWIKYDGNCYLFETKSQHRMSYYDAEDYCRSQGAHLASVHSAKENEFILDAMLEGRFGGRLWIGLNILDGEDEYKWSDDSSVDYKKIVEKPFYKKEKCFMMFHKERGWRPEHCALHYAPICKRSEDAKPTAIPPPPTVAPPTGNCPQDWIQFGQKCYRYYGAAEEDRLKYGEARNFCWNLGKEYSLVSIHSREEQAFLTKNLHKLGTSAWIGINYVSSDEIGHEMVFGWVDNSRNDFDFWAKGHPPRGTWKYCGRLNYEGINKGEWVADYCEIPKTGYICQRDSDPNLPVPVPEPTKCAAGSEGYRNSCYRFMSDPQTQEKAEAMCQQLWGGRLVSVADGFEQAFLHSYLIKQTKPIGIGLETVEETEYLRWTDGQPVYYTNWADKEPRLSVSKKSCVLMDPLDDFRWKVADCNKQASYVCKMPTDVPPVFPEVLGSCPTAESSWIDIGNEFCYHVPEADNHILSWDTASRYCTSKGMKMISVHSEHEMNSLVARLWQETYVVHLGLIRSFDKKSFMWMDGSPLDYTNWADREPSSWSSSKNCVAFSQNDGKWAPIDCAQGGVTICRADKIIKKTRN